MSKLAVVAVLVCAAAVGALVVLRTADGAPGVASLTLAVQIDPKSLHTLDLSPKGPSAGDMSVYSATLSRGGRPVGRLEGETTAADPLYQGDVSTQYLVLRDGTVAVVGGGQSGAPGVGRPDSRIFDSIVGGSGRFAGAGGWVTVKDISDSVELMTLHFTR